MGKVWTDASTTLAEANLNKMLSGDNTTGQGGAGIACWGSSVYWVSGTTFGIHDYWGAKNIQPDLTATWVSSSPYYFVDVDCSAIGHIFYDTTYGPVVVASQDGPKTVPYHIMTTSVGNHLYFYFYSMGSTPAIISTPDTNMDFHFIVWGYIHP